MSATLSYRGAYTALVTPFRDGRPDFDTLSAIVERQIESGIDGLVPVGTTGESPTLNNGEHLQVIEEVVRMTNGRVPVIAGTGANATPEAISLTREAERLGADGFLQVAPYYNKPSQAGLVAHYSEIASVTEKPIMLYSIPGRCGIEISVDTVKQLVDRFPHVRTMKEASGDANRVRSLLEACGPDFSVLSGDDGVTVEFARAGGSGVVSVAANLMPQPVVALARACLKGDFEAAEEILNRQYALFHDLVFLDGNPVTIKEAMFQTGLLPSIELRLPLVRTSPENRERIGQLLANLGIQAPC